MMQSTQTTSTQNRKRSRSIRAAASSATIGLSLLLLFSSFQQATSFESNEPTLREVNLNVAVFTNTVPLAYFVEEPKEKFPFPNFQGYQPDLLREVQKIALELDNITLSLDVQVIPGLSDYAPNLFYSQKLNYIADDCNTSDAVANKDDCHQFHLYLADYYVVAERSSDILFSPAMLTTSAAAVKYVHRKKRAISTIEEAQALGEPICLLNDSYYDTRTLAKYPNVKSIHCHSQDECLGALMEEQCALFVEDELQLKHLAKQDPDLTITREHFNEVFVAWPLNKRLMDPELQVLFVKWIYHAKSSGVMDALYDKYFSIDFCPIGKAGPNCTSPCSPSHGLADRYGNCVCESTKWSGDDCSVEVLEDKNKIPRGLLYACYAMVAINFALCACCGFWLWANRERAQVKASQPSFLLLVLLGCVISTSTIIAFALEDEGDGTVPGCMAWPWLYSVGFCITFGALFAKIFRVYKVFHSAAKMTKITVSFQETAMMVGLVLAIDAMILTVWTIVDPLRWKRTVTAADKYGEPLSSEGHCTSDHWEVFASILAAFHLLLIAVACYMCYLTRDLPSRFSDSKNVAMAMFSNLQVMLVAIPVLVILGAEPGISFFVRSAMIFINDWVVVSVIFGHLIYAVHKWDRDAKLRANVCSSQTNIQEVIRSYAKYVREKGSVQSTEQSKNKMMSLSSLHSTKTGSTATDRPSEKWFSHRVHAWDEEQGVPQQKKEVVGEESGLGETTSNALGLHAPAEQQGQSETHSDLEEGLEELDAYDETNQSHNQEASQGVDESWDAEQEFARRGYTSESQAFSGGRSSMYFL